MNNQVVSKQRVADHGEVYTGEREVGAMLDLVKDETERIDSRFLEPACGHGNFLAEILRRKLRVVSARYGRSQLDWERNAVLAVSSIYGIDLLADNVEQCRERLLAIFDGEYGSRFKAAIKVQCHEAVLYILKQNIVWGDALTLQTTGEKPRPIVFPEWSLVGGSQMKRRDFMFSFLVEKTHQFSLFNDEGEEAYLSQPVSEYPLTHFLEVAHADQRSL